MFSNGIKAGIILNDFDYLNDLYQKQSYFRIEMNAKIVYTYHN